MTDQAINEAIAKACGMTQIKTIGEKFVAWAIPAGPEDDHWSERPPNYCSDLNTMDEALKILSYKQQPIYLDILTRKVLMKDEGVSSWDRHTATARQRAEAFLRTLNLWRDDTTERKETK